MEKFIISKLKKEIHFLKKKIICFVNVETDPWHGNWKYMISSESPGKADIALLSHLLIQGYFSLCFIHW